VSARTHPPRQWPNGSMGKIAAKRTHLSPRVDRDPQLRHIHLALPRRHAGSSNGKVFISFSSFQGKYIESKNRPTLKGQYLLSRSQDKKGAAKQSCFSGMGWAPALLLGAVASAAAFSPQPMLSARGEISCFSNGGLFQCSRRAPAAAAPVLLPFARTSRQRKSSLRREVRCQAASS
jgi:hypothetical protein